MTMLDRITASLLNDPEFTREDNSGFGLSMMKERIYLLSGKISISSKPGEGCIVKVIIPVNKED